MENKRSSISSYKKYIGPNFAQQYWLDKELHPLEEEHEQSTLEFSKISIIYTFIQTKTTFDYTNNNNNNQVFIPLIGVCYMNAPTSLSSIFYLIIIYI